MKKRFFPFLIALSALSVSASAAFYSVFGLSKLFAGASTEVIIMAGALEAAKLIAASLLYQYWKVINKILRAYLVVAVFVLMVITSGGIYGFLSGAFEETNTQSQYLEAQVEIVDKKRTRFEENKSILVLEKEQLNKSISDLRISLSNPTQVSYWDENSQTVITTTSSSTRRALQKELNTTILERDTITSQINSLTDSIAVYDVKILEQQIGNESARELGPLKYMAKLTGQPMENIVNWFMLLIIFVFDPLAIAMVIAANMAFAQIKPKIKDLSPEQISRELDKNVIEVKPTLFTGEVTGSCPPGLKYNTPYTVDEIKEKWSKAEKDIEEGKNVYGEDRLEKIEEFIKKSQGTDKRGNRIWKADIDF
jgi:hypothetical protein